MKKIYYINCKKYRQNKILEISYIFYKTLVVFIICSRCGSKNKRIFKEEESLEV